MSGHRDPSGTQPRAVPTLGEYAEIIHWLVAHPNEEIPKEMRRVFDDAIDRAELRRFARALTASVEDGEYTEAADWQMRVYDAFTAPPSCTPHTVAKRQTEPIGGHDFELIAIDEAAHFDLTDWAIEGGRDWHAGES